MRYYAAACQTDLPCPRTRREIPARTAELLAMTALVFAGFGLLLPLSPLWGAFAVSRSPVWRGGVLAACLVGQWWWIYNMYALANTAFWTIP